MTFPTETPTIEEAIALQAALASQVRIEPLGRKVETIAGGDLSFNRDSDIVYAGFAVVRLSDLTVIERQSVVVEAKFPYVPGLLSFREIPSLLQVWEKLEHKPDAVMLDGQGLAHPRRMGIACHFGLLVDRPAIGCAKTLLVGRPEEPSPQRGDWCPIIQRKETVGAVLRTKDRVKPIFVSPGHLMDLDDAIRLTLACHTGYRIPEPTRQAHLYVNELRRAGLVSAPSMVKA